MPLTQHVTTIRGVYRYGYENRLIEASKQMGSAYESPSGTEARAAQQAAA